MDPPFNAKSYPQLIKRSQTADGSLRRNKENHDSSPWSSSDNNSLGDENNRRLFRNHQSYSSKLGLNSATPPPQARIGSSSAPSNSSIGLHSHHKSATTYGAIGIGSSYHHQSQLQGSMISLSPRIEFEEEQISTRYENLQEMRPYHLIGKSTPLADWNSLRLDDQQVAEMKDKKLRKFYQKQNELIDRYTEIDQLLDSGISLSMLREYGDDLPRIHAPDDSRQGAPANIDTEGSPLINRGKQEESGVVMLAIYVNFAINVLLLGGKTAVTILTNSLSVLASLVDSVLDFMSTLIIWISTRLANQSDWTTKRTYPIGRSKLTPIGVLIFSVLIIVSFLQIASQAIQALWKGEGTVVNLTMPSIIIMVLTVVFKVFCWAWCRSINSSAVQALAQDAMTDIVFNVFSIVFPMLSKYTHLWWFDPLGALLLSCYIVYSWGMTALEHIDNLTGTAASDEDRQVLLYTCTRFAESIRQITCLNAYHTGDRIMVEVDLVLDGTLNLKDSHDIGEALQYALETLPFVERAFVHLDYRTGNFTGHLDN